MRSSLHAVRMVVALRMSRERKSRENHLLLVKMRAGNSFADETYKTRRTIVKVVSILADLRLLRTK